jgi:hypothetical protein
MPKLIFEKDESGLRITLRNAMPSIVRDAAPNSENFLVRFDLGNDSVTAELTPTALQNLGLQCVALMPQLGPQYTIASVEDAYRLPARLLKELDDRSIQLLLRELQSDSLIDFLWYMKDADLIKLMLRNMSERAAEMLMDDLDRRWRGKNPDQALKEHAQSGREATQEIMAIVRRLIAEGQLPDVLGEGRRDEQGEGL